MLKSFDRRSIIRYLDHYWTEAGRHPFLIQVVAEYTHGAYTEEHLDSEEWRGPCQRFQNSPVKA